MQNNNNNLRQGLERFRDDLQKRVSERMSRPSVTASLQKQNQTQSEKKSPWILDYRNDKATYNFMAISALFTAMLGIILGLAPYTITAADLSTSIYWHNDLVHVAIAIVYAISFVAVTEAALLVAKSKYRSREEGNATQETTMLVMMVIAGISIVGTGYAGGLIGASVLGFLSDFKEIPSSAQGWVVKVVPVLIALYAFLLIGYKNSSEAEKADRLIFQLKEEQRREHRLNRDMTDLEVEEMMMLAEDRAYIDAVTRGVLSAADASAARKAGKTLGQLEAERGEDLNGDGFVRRPRPNRQELELVNRNNNGQHPT